MSFATAAQFYIDEATVTASVRTGDAFARLVRAALAMLQEQLALGLLFALLTDPGSSLQTPLIALGQHVIYFAVASVVHTFRILHDAFVIAVAVLAQFGARQTAGVVRIRMMTQTAGTKTVFAKCILNMTIAVRTTTFSQTNGLVAPPVREVGIVGASASAFSTFRLRRKRKLTLDVLLTRIADTSSHS